MSFVVIIFVGIRGIENDGGEGVGVVIRDYLLFLCRDCWDPLCRVVILSRSCFLLFGFIWGHLGLL